MGIRSMMYPVGARAAKAVTGRTVGRSSGALGRMARRSRSSGARAAAMNSRRAAAVARSTSSPRNLRGVNVGRINGAIPMRPARVSGRSSGAAAAAQRPRFNNGPGRFPQGRIPAVHPDTGERMVGAGRFRSRNVGGEAILNDMEALRPQPGPGRLQRTGAFAKRHPFMLGGMGVAMGYRGGSQSTGPGATTTNTTGVYQY